MVSMLQNIGYCLPVQLDYHLVNVIRGSDFKFSGSAKAGMIWLRFSLTHLEKPRR